jgi:hypothetical protein
MLRSKHHDVRTTLSLDEDVAARLKSEVRRSGKPFKEIVNECLRLALASRSHERGRQPRFEVKTRDLGTLRPGLSLDNVGDLLDAVEGPEHR